MHYIYFFKSLMKMNVMKSVINSTETGNLQTSKIGNANILNVYNIKKKYQRADKIYLLPPCFIFLKLGLVNLSQTPDWRGD